MRGLEIVPPSRLPFVYEQPHEAVSSNLRSDMSQTALACPCLSSPSHAAFFSPHQLNGAVLWLLKKVGPCHQSRFLMSSNSSIPREAMSAGLSKERTCFHIARGSIACVSETLVAANFVQVLSNCGKLTVLNGATFVFATRQIEQNFSPELERT